MKKPTNQEIVDILNMNLDLNGANTIYDLNELYVGDEKRYRTKNGDILLFVAEKGETNWAFGKRVWSYNQTHPENPIVKPDTTPIKEEEKASVTPGGITSENNSGLPLWLALTILGVLGIAVLIYFILQKKKKEQNSDPVTSGLPMYEGGTNDQNALEHLRAHAQQQFGVVPTSVRNITKGKLTGKKLIVGYTPAVNYNFRQRLWAKLMGRKIVNGVEYQTKTFTKPVTAYRALVTFPGGIEDYVYDLGPCGNRIKRGEGMGGGYDVQFVADQQQPVVLTDYNRTQVQPAVIQSEKTKQTDQPVAESHFLKLAKIADDAMKNGDEVVFATKNGEVKIQLKEKKFSLNGKEQHQPVITAPGAEEPAVSN